MSSMKPVVINHGPSGEPHYYGRADYRKRTGLDDLVRDPKDKSTFWTPTAWKARCAIVQELLHGSHRTRPDGTSRRRKLREVVE